MARQSSHAFLQKMRRCREKETEVARGTIHQRLAQGNGFFCRSCARVLRCQFGSAEPQSPTFLCTDCLRAVSLKRALACFRGFLGLPNAGSAEPHFLNLFAFAVFPLRKMRRCREKGNGSRAGNHSHQRLAQGNGFFVEAALAYFNVNSALPSRSPRLFSALTVSARFR